MKDKKIYYIIVGIALFIFSLYLGISYALQSVSSSFTNSISTGTLSGELIETGGNVDGDVYPGSKIDKTVQVKNTGSTNALVRVKVTRLIGIRNPSGEITSPNASSSSSTIGLNVIDKNNNIKYPWGSRNGINNWHYIVYDRNGNTTSTNPNDMNSSLTLYFYYMKVLKPGEVTDNLIDEIEINSGISSIYGSNSIDVKFDAEMIQATKGAAKSIWNLSDDQISKIYNNTNLDDEKSYDDVSVTFNSSTSGFDVDPSDVGIFKNFKNLQPGMTINQTITLKNNYTDTAGQTFYLRAEPVNSSDEKVIKLLKEYAIITVKDQDDNILYNGPVWNEEEGSYMVNDILLATVPSGSSKKIKVTLALDSKMGNEYQSLSGDVKWNFITNFDDSRVIVRHYLWDKVKNQATSVKVSSDNMLSGLIGTNYSTTSKDLEPKYTLKSSPSNAKGVYANGIIYVDYYYTLNNSTIVDPVLEISTDTKVVSSKEQIINYAIDYKSSISSYYGDAIYKIVVQLPAYVTCTNADAGNYDSVNNTITWNVDLNNINNLNSGSFDIDFSKNISVKLKEDADVSNIKSMTVSANGVLELPQTGEKKTSLASSTVDFDVAKEAVVTVNHYYKDSTGDKVETETINTFVGSEYATSPLSDLTSIGYKVIRIEGSASGTVSSENVVVNYHYKLVNSDNPPTGDTIAIICTIFIISVIICILSMIYLVYSGKIKKKK